MEGAVGERPAGTRAAISPAARSAQGNDRAGGMPSGAGSSKEGDGIADEEEEDPFPVDALADAVCEWLQGIVVDTAETTAAREGRA